jgi:hypothetical protein
VLSAPPAFVLSQDQTLSFIPPRHHCSPDPPPHQAAHPALKG